MFTCINVCQYVNHAHTFVLIMRKINEIEYDNYSNEYAPVEQRW